MSSSNAASQAAALAAFKAKNAETNDSDNDIYKNNKYAKRTLQADPRGNIPREYSQPYVSKVPLKKLDVSASRLSRGGESSPATPTSILTDSGIYTSHRDSPYGRSESVSAFKNPDNESIAKKTDYFNAKDVSQDVKKRPTLKQSQTAPLTAIQGVKKSIDSKTIQNIRANKALSPSMQPEEMIKNIKSSINSKAKTLGPETRERNQSAINEIRETINLKKVSTYRNKSPSPVEQNRNRSHNLSDDEPPREQQIDDNASYSSSVSTTLGSSYYPHPETPKIVVNHELPETAPNMLKNSKSNSQTSIANQTIEELKSENEDSFDEEDTSRDDSPRPQKYVSPILLTESLSSFSKSFDGGSKESLSQSPYIRRGANKSSDSSLNVNDERSKEKLRRKPPPDLDNGSHLMTIKTTPCLESNENVSDTSIGCSSSRSLLNNSDFFGLSGDESSFLYVQKEKDPSTEGVINSSMSKFPQFPDIAEARHQKHLDHKPKIFKKKYKLKGGNDAFVNPMDLDVESELDWKLDSDAQERISRPTTPAAPQQHVQLKTTMRTSSKRSKKLQFNENKPWKNHSELNYITEQERKRYEGVWTSNKGLYMHAVVTKLAGVSYDETKPSDFTATDNEMISTKAARLSASVKGESSYSDNAQQFHDLESADIDQLIHGVVVKRLWMRSRLPRETLETIWNLVDFRKDGTLNKQEFLVGIWLVDQSLYGRKLPKKVDDVVWDSLGNIGINVMIKKKGRR
ncbi:uncharacterized protein PRCAT00002606001 [Priceomyces carsonii]|uniref:uncharacterized protein n=1 Tax=Priceomyces carsonii TaxID=28549 RepID=UPI002ED781A7|nr:unnamed protein product [Priceomyces carsonii]